MSGNTKQPMCQMWVNTFFLQDTLLHSLFAERAVGVSFRFDRSVAAGDDTVRAESVCINVPLPEPTRHSNKASTRHQPETGFPGNQNEWASVSISMRGVGLTVSRTPRG